MNTKFFLLVALVLGACENIDTQNPDDTGDTTLYEASFTASLNQYGWEGDEVVLLGSSDENADYLASNGEETVSGTTPDVLELAGGTWSSSYFYDESTMLYIGSASADISDSSDLGASLCADLSGDWECDDGMHPDTIEIDDATMNGCAVVFEGITTDSHPFEVDGNRLKMVGPEGSIIDGIASSDSIVMILNRSDGFTCEMVCNRT